MWKYLKIILLITLFHTGLVYSTDFHREITPILRDWGFPVSEQEVIFAVFTDAEKKGLDLKVLIADLKERKIKNSSFYETGISLMIQSDRLYKIKLVDFPFQEDKLISQSVLYLIDIYTLQDLKSLSALFKKQGTNKKELSEILKLAVLMHSQGVNPADNFSILYLMLSRGQADIREISLAHKIFYSRKELKITGERLGQVMKKDLLKNKPVQKIYYELESESR